MTIIRSGPAISHWGDSKINKIITESSITDQRLTLIRSDHSITDFIVGDCESDKTITKSTEHHQRLTLIRSDHSITDFTVGDCESDKTITKSTEHHQRLTLIRSDHSVLQRGERTRTKKDNDGAKRQDMTSSRNDGH